MYGKDKFPDFSYIDDTVEGVIKCIEKFPEVKNGVFNISSGKSVSLIDLAILIRDSMKGNNSIVIKEGYSTILTTNYFTRYDGKK